VNAWGVVTYQVDLTITKGDGGGITFREDNDYSKGNFYLFGIDHNGGYGLYVVKGYSFVNTLRNASNAAIKTGLNQSNQIAVVARGSTIDLYANGQKIDSVSDSTYSQGYIGVFAFDQNAPTEVIFRNAKVWSSRIEI
jgi:hypothetical protein